MQFLIHNPKTNIRKMQAGEMNADQPARVQTGVGIIPVVGTLSQRPDWFSCGSTYQGIITALEKFEAEPSISAIVLDVDSCGGSADGAFETAERIRASSKPIIAYGRGLVASAAYLLYGAAHRRVAHRSALVGSVGAYECHYVGGSDELKFIVSTQSPDKLPDPSLPEGEAVIQARVDALADLFIGDLARYFNTTPEKIKADFGGGQVIFAEAAQRVGMVDEVGNFKTALASVEKIQKPIDAPTAAGQGVQQVSAVKTKRAGGTRMARKMAFTITDEANVTEGAETYEVTKDIIKEKFPEIYAEIQKEAIEAVNAEAAEVEDAAETADMENPEEKEAVMKARSGKMSANELRKTLLSAKAKFANSEEGKRRQMAAARDADKPIIIQQGMIQTQKSNPFARFVGK